ncbi:glycosyltransferase [Methylomonas sp. MO1]|uniref:glycosyltransferase n=1 Tax=Methylomonas sp. MO1 TaxID=3073619 RepID=UPI0028A5117B|nr:glycosyltransferase [Methylomonas sp. MO1]MDT4291639.1 glycosyltransferase [Methylomonas sp. MO1]
MAIIVFCIHPITGSINASLKIARELRCNGHRIFYIGLPQSKKTVHRSGFDFISIFSKWFPECNESYKGSTGLSRIMTTRKYVKYLKRFIDALMLGEDKEFFELINQLRPDMMVIVATHYDSFLWGLLAYKAGLKSVYLHDTLCKSKRLGTPPITTALTPENSVSYQFIVQLEWMIFYFKDFFYSTIIGICLSKNYGVKKLCEHYGYPIDLVDLSTDMLGPKIKLTELVLCPKYFDFPSYNEVGRYYIGASIDLERTEPNFCWEIVDKDKPLVYCSLGSLEYLPKTKKIKFFQTVIAVAQQKINDTWIISVGNELDISRFYNVADNVILVNYAPQLSILKRASVIITHGGTNTIKECILFGVPMIVFPLGFDHPGNAARVVYHGLGICGDLKTLTTTGLINMLEMIKKTSYFRERISFMRKEFESAELENKGVELINEILAI